MDGDSYTDLQLGLLADSSNRAITTALDEAGQPLHVETLAERLVDRDLAVARSAEYDSRIERARLSLHHERLPKLAEAGLVEYDPDANVATHRDDRVASPEWQDASTVGEVVSHFATDHEAGEVGVEVIEGREPIVRYGRRLADEAEEELFCMYVSTDLLEEECVRRAENALDRGVRMYVGSGDAEVRELARKHLPEATLWEPQLDWTNTPTRPRLGRLVLVDRRKVMLAVLGEPEPDGDSPAETAVVGAGEDHPLVVLVRELLGSRLDHLDFQSEDFRSELPS